VPGIVVVAVVAVTPVAVGVAVVLGKTVVVAVVAVTPVAMGFAVMLIKTVVTAYVALTPVAMAFAVVYYKTVAVAVVAATHVAMALVVPPDKSAVTERVKRVVEVTVVERINIVAEARHITRYAVIRTKYVVVAWMEVITVIHPAGWRSQTRQVAAKIMKILTSVLAASK